MFDPSLMVQQTNPGERFAQAFQHGMQQREANMAKAAQAALARDPTNQRALEAWSKVDPQGAMQFQQQQRQNHLKDLDAHRDSIKVGAQIIRSFNVKDEATYQAAKQFAASNGIDISQLPPSYDKDYVANVIHLADALDPEKVQQDRIITPQPGGGAWSLGQDGQLHQLIAPNDGSQPSGAPVGGMPEPGTIVADPRMQGGATGAAPSSMFP